MNQPQRQQQQQRQPVATAVPVIEQPPSDNSSSSAQGPRPPEQIFETNVMEAMRQRITDIVGKNEQFEQRLPVQQQTHSEDMSSTHEQCMSQMRRQYEDIVRQKDSEIKELQERHELHKKTILAERTSQQSNPSPSKQSPGTPGFDMGSPLPGPIFDSRDTASGAAADD